MSEGIVHSVASHIADSQHPGKESGPNQGSRPEKQARSYPELNDAEFDLVQSFIQHLFPAYDRRGLEFQAHVARGDGEQFAQLT